MISSKFAWNMHRVRLKPSGACVRQNLEISTTTLPRTKLHGRMNIFESQKNRRPIAFRWKLHAIVTHSHSRRIISRNIFMSRDTSLRANFRSPPSVAPTSVSSTAKGIVVMFLLSEDCETPIKYRAFTFVRHSLHLWTGAAQGMGSGEWASGEKDEEKNVKMARDTQDFSRGADVAELRFIDFLNHGDVAVEGSLIDFSVLAPPPLPSPASLSFSRAPRSREFYSSMWNLPPGAPPCRVTLLGKPTPPAAGNSVDRAKTLPTSFSHITQGYVKKGIIARTRVYTLKI